MANDDALDAGLASAMAWVVRRTLIRVAQPAVLGERLTATTFCSGTGRSWAERRTSIVGDRGAVIEAVSLWVQIDTVSGRPARLGDDFFAIYGEAGGGRTVSSRLSLGPPPADAEVRPWPVRISDLDVFGHANNAVLWSVLEEAMIGVETARGNGRVRVPGTGRRRRPGRSPRGQRRSSGGVAGRGRRRALRGALDARRGRRQLMSTSSEASAE